MAEEAFRTRDSSQKERKGSASFESRAEVHMRYRWDVCGIEGGLVPDKSKFVL